MRHEVQSPEVFLLEGTGMPLYTELLSYFIFEFLYSGGINMFAHNAGNFEGKAQGIL